MQSGGAASGAGGFSLAGIQRALNGRGDSGVAGDTGYVGVGGYNFMGSDRARAMGMGDVQHGGANASLSFPTGIESGGPAFIRANKYAGPDIAGFLHDLHEAGAPLVNYSSVYVNKPLQHGLGNAVDIETGFGDGPDNSPALFRWAQEHPQEFAEIQAKHHMRNLHPSSGSSVRDWGHFEWTPQRRATEAERLKRKMDTDRSGIDKSNAGSKSVNGGKMNVDVNVKAPKGSKSDAEGDGVFEKVRINKTPQMGTGSEHSGSDSNQYNEE
jgi:hypothetical protein